MGVCFHDIILPVFSKLDFTQLSRSNLHGPLFRDEKRDSSIGHPPPGIIYKRSKRTWEKVMKEQAKLMELEEVNGATRRGLLCIHTGREVGFRYYC